MKVKKDNRILTIAEQDKNFYLSQGYDVVEFTDGKYNITETATGGRTYSIAEYNELKAENQALKEELAKLNTQDEFDREAVKAELTALGVEFKGNASNEALKKLLEDSK